LHTYSKPESEYLLYDVYAIIRKNETATWFFVVEQPPLLRRFFFGGLVRMGVRANVGFDDIVYGRLR